MKKLFILFFLGLMLVCFTSCSQTNEKELKFGFDAEYPPFGYLDTDTGEYTGFDIEYAKAVCEKINYKLKLVPIDWDAKDAELSSGNIDCIWSGFTINGREDDYEWTDAYVDNSIVVLTKKTSGIEVLNDLSGKTVSVQMSSSGQTALDSNENKTLVSSFKNGKYLLCADYSNAFMELETGAIDAIVIDINVAKYLISGKTDNYVILTEQISSEKYGVGFKKGNTELCKLVNDAMISLAKDGTVDQIAKKYNLTDSICIGK